MRQRTFQCPRSPDSHLDEFQAGREVTGRALSKASSGSNLCAPSQELWQGHDGLTVSRAEFESNPAAKLKSAAFLKDVRPPISTDVSYDPIAASELVHSKLISRLPGEPWEGLGR